MGFIHEFCKKDQSQKGMSLISAMVSLVVAGMVITTLSRFMANANKSQHALEMRGDVEAMRRNILAQVSCSQTVAAAGTACDSNTPTAVALMNNSGTVISGMTATGKTQGGVIYNGKCYTNGSQKVVELYVTQQNLSAAANFGNPMNNKVVDIGCSAGSTSSVANMCTALGGTWSGSACAMPTPDPQGMCTSMGGHWVTGTGCAW